jgi:hypothetical protein
MELSDEAVPRRVYAEVELSSEMTMEDVEDGEESTTKDEGIGMVASRVAANRTGVVEAVLPALPVDAWLIIATDLSIWDIGAATMVCKGWRGVLTTDRIWKVLCARYAVPEKKAPLPPGFNFYAHWREHARGIVGPTLNFRQTPSIDRINFPPKIAHDLEKAFEERNGSCVLMGQEGILVVAEVGVALLQLNQPFRWSRASFEADTESGNPVPQRRAWTDGVHAVAQSAFKGKAVKMPIKIFQVHIKPKCTAVHLQLMGEVCLGKFEQPDHPYLMGVFFAKTYFILEMSEQSLRSSVLIRVELGSLEATSFAKLAGVSLGTGSVSGEERMPSITFHNWKCFVLRKFPDEKKAEDRSRLYVYGPRLELLHEYGPPVGENWRFPFFVKVFDPFVMLAYYTKEHYE